MANSLPTFPKPIAVFWRIRSRRSSIKRWWMNWLFFQVDAQRYRYDFLGCGLRLLGVRSVFDRRYTCSHFVAQLLENAKIHTFSAGTMMARPADFMDIPGIRVIYEGKLSDYRKSDAIFTIP